MYLAIFRKTIWVILAPLVLTAGGCGGNKAKVTGRVTLGGQPVESGFITFFPEDKGGTSAMAEIVGGEYTIEDLAPGKKRLYVNITERSEPGPGDTATRNESNRERLTESKKRQTKSKQPAPPKIDGNNKIVTIVSGSQKIDIPLEKQSSGK